MRRISRARERHAATGKTRGRGQKAAGGEEFVQGRVLENLAAVPRTNLATGEWTRGGADTDTGAEQHGHQVAAISLMEGGVAAR